MQLPIFPVPHVVCRFLVKCHTTSNFPTLLSAVAPTLDDVPALFVDNESADLSLDRFTEQQLSNTNDH